MATKRRPMLNAILATAILACALPASGCADKGPETSYLFTQAASGGTLTPSDVEPGAYTLTLTGASPRTIRFTDRPRREASSMLTSDFVKGWNGYFGDDPPNAAVVITGHDSPTGVTTVAILDGPGYDEERGSLTYKARPVIDPEPDDEASWKGSSLSEMPTSFGPASLFIDDADPTPDNEQADDDGGPETQTGAVGRSPDTPSDAGSTGDDGEADLNSGKQFYGLCYSPNVKTIANYEPIPTGFVDSNLDTFAPFASWFTTYRVTWPGATAPTEINHAIRTGHSHGLKVAACAWIYWDPSNLPASRASNESEVTELINLVNGGFSDIAVVGNEPMSNRGPAGAPYPLSTAASELAGLINRVKQATGGRVKVGTRLEGGVGNDADYKTIASACDFIQITVHPANWARQGQYVTDIDSAIRFLDNSYKTARAQLDSWGLTGVELQIGETGWPTSADDGRNRALFTTANARAYSQKVASWASAGSIKVFWFESLDEPVKGNYDRNNFESNWGVWRWNPADPADPFPPGQPVKGSYVKKY